MHRTYPRRALRPYHLGSLLVLLFMLAQASCLFFRPLFCGDGHVTTDAELVDLDGDGEAETIEECDDGNQASGDGCELDCSLSCGNGIVDNGEPCDDGNDLAGDGCEPGCALICGADTNAAHAALDPVTGTCYLGFDVQLNWQDAQTDCVAQGGNLVVVADAAENDLARLASARARSYWIGVNDIAVEAGANALAFVNVTGGNIVFNGFDVNQPDNFNANEDCVQFRAGSATWNDLSCLSGLFYICEITP